MILTEQNKIVEILTWVMLLTFLQGQGNPLFYYCTKKQKH